MNDESQGAEFRTLDASGAEKFKNELRLGVESVGILTDDNQQFLFRLTSVGNVLAVDGVKAAVVPPAGRVLKVGESAQLVCLMSDGCYLVRVHVRAVDGGEVRFVFEKDIHRLERRNDCRTLVPPGFAISFRLNSVNRALVSNKAAAPSSGHDKLAVIDVSSRGFRLRWTLTEVGGDSNSGLPELKVGDHVSGELSLPAGRRAEIFAAVRNLGSVNGQLQVGLELQNPTIRDEQLLLFACMHIRQQTAL